MNRYWVLLFFLALGSAAWSQDLRLGPRVGLSSSSMSVDVDGSDISSNGSKVGFHFGAFGRVGIKDWYVQPEALFTFNGGERKDAVGTVTSIDFTRLDVPIMIGRKFAKIARANVGPVASFVLAADAETSGQSTDVKEFYESSIWGLQIGVGADIWKLAVDLKYETTLGNISKQKIGSVEIDEGQSQILLSIGYNLLNL